MDRSYKTYGLIGPVTIGSGFRTEKNRQNLYPKDRLVVFLNLDTSKEESVYSFCGKYLLIPRNLTKGWVNSFKEEQQKAKAIVRKIAEGDLTKETINTINQELESITTKLTLLDNGKIILLNEQLEGYEPGEGDYGIEGLHRNKDKHLVKVERHKNSLSSIWQDLANLLLKQSNLKNCAECGLFFIPNKRAPKQKFCSDLCRDRYTKRKNYRRKKK